MTKGFNLENMHYVIKKSEEETIELIDAYFAEQFGHTNWKFLSSKDSAEIDDIKGDYADNGVAIYFYGSVAGN